MIITQTPLRVSFSGNSPNILRAVDYANQKGLKTIGITAFDEGRLRNMAQLNIHISCGDMGMSEALHAIAFHLVISQLRERIDQHLFLRP